MMKTATLCAMGLLASSTAMAADSGYEAFVQGGHTQGSSPGQLINQFAVGVGVGVPWSFRDGRVSSRLDASLAYIDTKRGDVAQATVMPVLRYQPSAVGYFVEAGLGLSYVSKQRWSRSHDLGSNFHFASRIGGGYDFGKYAVGLNLSHISNAGLADHNDGANQVDIRMSWKF